MPTTTEIWQITDDVYTALIQPTCTPPPEELFEFQRTRLAESQLALIGAFDHFANRLPGQGLFLLVPPQPPALDWNGLMDRVELNGKNGRNYLDQTYHKDLIEVPDVPTMLLGIEDGRGRQNVKPFVSREAIRAEGRIAYHTWRGFIHVLLFPVVLKDHNMDMVGSRYATERVPGFYLSDDEPILLHNWDADAAPKWGAPSCGSVER